MTDALQSKGGDKILLGMASFGVSVAIIPEKPPKPDALDVFTLNIRFTNVARIAAMLEQGGTYTSAGGNSTITTEQGEYVIRMPFEHDPRSLFTAVLDHANSKAFSQFLQGAMAGVPPALDEDAATSAASFSPRVGRNDPCPCGSGKKYKRCCISKEPQQRVEADPRRIPPELRPLAESHDPLCRAYVDDFVSNPDLKRDPDFWRGAGSAIFTCGQPYAALACLEIACRLAPPSNALLLDLAATMSACDNHEESLSIIDKLPRDVARRAVIRANTLQSLERHEEAISEYQNAIAEEPQFYLPYARLLNSLNTTGSSLYEHWLNRAIDALPQSPVIAQYFVRFCQQQRRFDDLADAEWLDHLEADLDRRDVIGRGRDEPAIIMRCQVLHLAARALRDRSREDLKRAAETLKALPESSQLCDAGRFIADVAAVLGEPGAVRVGWNRICKRCVHNQIGLPKSGLTTYLALAHVNRSENAQAVALCEQVDAIESDDPTLLRSYWWALDEVGRTPEAISVAERLETLDETDSPLFYNLGWLCGKEGQFGKARYYYRKEVEAAPTNGMAWENLSFIHLLASQVTESEQCYREYQRLRDEDLGLCEVDYLIDDGHMSPGGTDGIVHTGNAFAELARRRHDAKDNKFAELVQHARRTTGSMSYSIDLVAVNNATNPVVGSQTNLRPVFLSPAQILANLAGGAACNEELQFHVASQQRADASTVIVSIGQHLASWRSLPETAQRSLIEAERLFHVGMNIDSSPAIVSYAKAFEICLYERVFKPFKDRSGADFRIEQHVKAVLADPQSKAIRLARFVEAGHALELGTMTFLLQLCTGRTCERIPLLAALRDHIDVHLGSPNLLSKDYLAAAESLASRFRNKAAHERTFDTEACREAREIVYRLLNGVPSIQCA